MTKKKDRKTCEKCGAIVNINNYSQHMSNAHGLNSGTGSARNKIAIIAVVSIVLIAIAWGYNSTLNTKQITSTAVTTENSVNTKQITSTAVTTENSDSIIQSNNESDEAAVKIPISEIGDSAKFYTYDSKGETAKYFGVKGSDGKIHVAIDACDVCYSRKRGYEQTGNVMTCGNCGQTFAINSIGTANLSGGCWPSYLPYEVDGENIIINKSDLDQKLFMFK
ncbi:hypothetical protein A3K80_08150 [Candidatus Bathyarchaeota archaeon RBG_13_38_9]|nr:MAG: hypothetical protein A3K80_08150 [Candidatus Bathyarchaeota archaeon RBG_13_38_9]